MTGRGDRWQESLGHRLHFVSFGSTIFVLDAHLSFVYVPARPFVYQSSLQLSLESDRLKYVDPA